MMYTVLIKTVMIIPVYSFVKSIGGISHVVIATLHRGFVNISGKTLLPGFTNYLAINVLVVMDLPVQIYAQKIMKFPNTAQNIRSC